MRRFVSLTTLAALLVLAPCATAQDKWGTLKGTAVLEGNLPKLAPIAVEGQDKEHCLSKGPIPNEKYVVNAKNKGVRWVAVWLAVDKNGVADHQAKPPIHPSMEKITQPKVVMDQPCCRFEPRMVGLRVGQTFEGKNSSPVPHNMNIIGGRSNPNQNLLIAAGKSQEVANGWNATHIPVQVQCNIHRWMQAYVYVFAHPYFAITDEDGNFEIKNAPVGKFRLLAWQEGNGFLLAEKGKDPDKNGIPIEIKAGETTTIAIKVKPEE